MFQRRKVALLGLASLLALSQIGPANAVTVKSGLTACPIASSYTITSRSTGWLPTDEATDFATGPTSQLFSGSRTYVTPISYGGSVSISNAGLVAAANSKYGSGTYANPSSVTATWNWSYPLPSAFARLLILHRSDKVTFTEIQDNANCTSTTTTGLVAYLPLSASSQANFCRVIDVYPAKTNWSSTCVD